MTRSRDTRLTLVPSTQKNSDQLGLLVREEEQEKKRMKRPLLFASVIALGMGTASMLHGGRPGTHFSANDNVAQTTNGAFLAVLTVERRGDQRRVGHHVARGRWATAEDQ